MCLSQKEVIIGELYLPLTVRIQIWNHVLSSFAVLGPKQPWPSSFSWLLNHNFRLLSCKRIRPQKKTNIQYYNSISYLKSLKLQICKRPIQSTHLLILNRKQHPPAYVSEHNILYTILANTAPMPTAPRLRGGYKPSSIKNRENQMLFFINFS